MFSMCIYSYSTTYRNNPTGWGKVLQSLSTEETKAQGSKQSMHKTQFITEPGIQGPGGRQAQQQQGAHLSLFLCPCS